MLRKIFLNLTRRFCIIGTASSFEWALPILCYRKLRKTYLAVSHDWHTGKAWIGEQLRVGVTHFCYRKSHKTSLAVSHD